MPIDKNRALKIQAFLNKISPQAQIMSTMQGSAPDPNAIGEIDAAPSLEQATNVDGSVKPEATMPLAIGPAAEQEQMSPQERMIQEMLRNSQLTPEEKAMQAKWTGDQEASIDQLRGILSQMQGRKPSMDISPLLALSDSWTGSNLAKGYEKPQTAQEMLNDQAKVGNLISERSGDLSKMLMAKKASMSGLASLMGMEGRAGRFDDANTIKNENKLRDYYLKVRGDSKSGMVKDASVISNVESALNTGKLSDVTNTLGLMIKTIGGAAGAQTEGDVNRVFKRTIGTDLANMEAYLSRNPNVALPKETVQALKDVVNRTKATMKTQYTRQADFLKKSSVASPRYRQFYDDGAMGSVMHGEMTNDIENSFGGGGGSSAAQKPAQVSQSDWDMATPEEKAALSSHFQQAQR